ncbi:16S rRNA methyltransferase [Rhodosalinus halophilus]|uniref:16S rRNA methyltransferase n=1 Tax=Rhodosalinus halophilus TaxID=2259333 RepID=A0A365UAS2_9RHOB|nr:transcription antitermination factor NusB [Rhodosalinus halophilus]RBI85841.1 16S rRNA methyltransferase [Rhodosalinus halophilus]
MSRRPRPAGREGQPARRAALSLFLAVLEERRTLDEAEPALQGLAPEARARARRLVAETFRGLARADALLAPHLRRRPPAAALAALRLGTVELAQGGAAHGVVNDWVQIVAGAGRKPAAARGMVNAVLRKMAAEAPERWKTLPVPEMPAWLRGPVAEAWGEAAAAAIEAAHLAGAPLDLTAKGDPAALAARLGAELLPTGSLRLPRGAQVSALPGFAEGDWWVQDAGAALPALALAPRPAERVLDLCAAPGGKTMQLAAAGAKVTAVDLSAARLERVSQNLARTGLSARLLAEDARAHQGGPYEAILLDAPCSATGTIRRHPELPHIRDGSGVAALCALQAELVDHAVQLLAPGGRLVYCTCSLLPAEGEAQAEAALARHPGLRPDPEALDLPGIETDWRVPQGLRLRPDHWAQRGGIDGFFIAAFRRVA